MAGPRSDGIIAFRARLGERFSGSAAPGFPARFSALPLTLMAAGKFSPDAAPFALPLPALAVPGAPEDEPEFFPLGERAMGAARFPSGTRTAGAGGAGDAERATTRFRSSGFPLEGDPISGAAASRCV